jgi:hypothetical protein
MARCQGLGQQVVGNHQELEAIVQGQTFKPAGGQPTAAGPPSWGTAPDRLDLNLLLATALDHDKAQSGGSSVSIFNLWQAD